MEHQTTNTKFKSDKDAEFYIHDEQYDIMDVVMEIQGDRQNLSIDELGKKYPSFKRDFTPLFIKVCRTELSQTDITQLEYMLDMRKRVRDQELSFKEASGEVCITSAQKFQPELLNKK